MATFGDQSDVVSGSHCGEAGVLTVRALDRVGALFVGEGVDAAVAHDGAGLSVGAENESLRALAVVSSFGVDASVLASAVVVFAFVDFCAVVSVDRQVVSGVAGAHVSWFTLDSVYTGDVGASVLASEQWVEARVWDAAVEVVVQNEPFWAAAEV